jgi:hypothetical protein
MLGSRLLFGTLLALLMLAGAQAQDADPIVSAAHQALGGDVRIAAVKTIVATGRTRQVRGDNLIPVEFEIDIELPDKYTRIDEILAQEGGPTRHGFSGNSLIGPAGVGPHYLPPGPGRSHCPAPPRGIPVDPFLVARQELTRLTLGMFASSFDGYPVTFSYVGSAEVPEGTADVVSVNGPYCFAANFFVGRRMHLPLQIEWTDPPVPPQTAPTDNRLYYADYRDVNGLKLPFLIRRAIGTMTIEETTFDRFLVNAKIDPKKFEKGD